MALHRHTGRHPSGGMHWRRGGKVSLFNYNPSIAGGSISIHRHHKGHRMGHLMSRRPKHAVPLAAVPELMPNVSSHAAAFMHGETKNENRKRLRESIAHHLDKMNKRMK